jgi:DNA-directed RNA polymerase specialized sigma24 family protein
MNRQRKRNVSTPSQQVCLSNPEITYCPHCSYVLNEILNLESRWISIAMRIMKNEFMAQDLVYEFYSRKLPNKIHKLNIDDPQFNLRQYVARMIYNFALDELYKANRHGIIDSKYYVEGVTRDNDDQIVPNIIRNVEARDELNLIYANITINEFNLIQRMLLPEWSVKEEARNEGISPTAVRARLVRLRRKVNSILNTPPFSA